MQSPLLRRRPYDTWSSHRSYVMGLCTTACSYLWSRVSDSEHGPPKVVKTSSTNIMNNPEAAVRRPDLSQPCWRRLLLAMKVT